jgi:hypothetical protein
MGPRAEHVCVEARVMKCAFYLLLLSLAQLAHWLTTCANRAHEEEERGGKPIEQKKDYQLNQGNMIATSFFILLLLLFSVWFRL